jgi:5-methylcytosine-specific restriction endonuclease McrA
VPYKNKADRNFRREYKNYDGTPAVKKKRAERNAARAQMIKEGKAHKGDGKDVDHIKPLSKGGSTKRSNLRVVSAHKNRSYPRNSDKSMK